ncbi:MAG TPA: hypothetical protein VGL34_00815 [Steroidobacteraceae bacterium]
MSVVDAAGDGNRRHFRRYRRLRTRHLLRRRRRLACPPPAWRPRHPRRARDRPDKTAVDSGGRRELAAIMRQAGTAAITSEHVVLAR